MVDETSRQTVRWVVAPPTATGNARMVSSAPELTVVKERCFLRMAPCSKRPVISCRLPAETLNLGLNLGAFSSELEAPGYSQTRRLWKNRVSDRPGPHGAFRRPAARRLTMLLQQAITLSIAHLNLLGDLLKTAGQSWVSITSAA